ncbi:MAG: hypothetical protein FWD05_09730 [Oscillospiraceae bacterium]|nr:hypothetical protein [Oscillospiraceae bacterium]
MKRKITKPKMTRLEKIAMIFIIVCLVIVILGVCGYIRLDSRIRLLEGSSAPQHPSNLQIYIDFLRDQIQILIWILGVIVTGAGAIFAFLGISTRKAVDEKYDLKYNELIAERGAKIFQKQVVFLYQKRGENEILINFHDEMRERGYNTKLKKASILEGFCHADVNNRKGVKALLQEASVIVYHVNGASDPNYQEIAKWCESEGIHCIIFTGGEILPPEFSRVHWEYVSISQQLVKLRESIYILLHLAS